MANNNKDQTDRGGRQISAIRGQLLTFHSDPFLINPDESYDFYEDAMVVMEDGMIKDVGEYSRLKDKYPHISDIEFYKDGVIMSGFIDCHAHYVQSPMIGSYGDTLLGWLNEYAFPTEKKFSDKDFAGKVAKMFFRQLLRQGTTTANVFATTFAESVDAFFEESERYNTLMICGKVLQDRNLPDYLKDKDTDESVAVSEELLRKWHHKGRQLYAVIPRFAPTSTPRQLELAGDLYQRYVEDGVYLHTHLNEEEKEIEWVRELYPGFADYTDIYEHFGLVGPHSVFAHCCIMKEREWNKMHDNGCGCVHCPSSNLFLGDAMFRFWEAKDRSRPVKVGIGTDVGGGTNFSIFRQLGEAYKVGMLKGRSLDAIRSLYLATRGGAETLGLSDSIGNVKPGQNADLIVIDLKPDEFTEWRLGFCKDIFEKIFVLQTMGLDNLVRSTYVAGKKVYDRDSENKYSYA